MKGKIKTAEMKVSWCVRVYLILPPFSFSLGAFGVCMFAPFLSIITRQFVACSSVVYRRPVPIKRPVPRRAGPPFNRRFLEPTLVCPPNTRRHLRSADRHLLAVPRFRLYTYGRRAFSVAGPMAWNSLPDFIHGIQRAVQTVLGVYLKRTCSRVTSASSALGVLNDYALYNPRTHSLTQTASRSVHPFLQITQRMNSNHSTCDMCRKEPHSPFALPVGRAVEYYAQLRVKQ